MWPDNMNGSTWQWSENTMPAMGGEKRSMKPDESELVLRDQKRWKPSSSQTANEWSLDSEALPVSLSDYNPLNEPSPLGLNLKKSPSLLELIQARINQANSSKCTSPTDKSSQKKNAKEKVERPESSDPVDKLKASNFPAVLLRIGNWEYVSKREGDLVAKCYFAKHKLVWEVLDGGLKNKIEIQWSDIVGLKANCPDNGPGSLTVVLGRQPMFFRETDPQPRKHTVWQLTCDFTGGEAITYREHYLQCSQGVLNKHYEKLIQCDTRLNFFSQQEDITRDLRFSQKACIQAPNVLYNYGPNQLGLSKGFSLSSIKDKGTHGDLMKYYVHGESSSFEGSKVIGQVMTLNPQRTRSTISDIINCTGHCISPARVLPYFDNVLGGVDQNDMINNISQILLNDTEMSMEPDEARVMKKVNSLCNLIQAENEYHNPDARMNQNHVNGCHDGNDYSSFNCNPISEITSGNEDFRMRRSDSYTEFLYNLPRIASLPKILFDPSGNGEIINP
ncbi:uncharacterized protein [Rutidosis leptorrhynchoides]|uniref:uncharacterized protein n=1 Tax=Rutidosis leptorrhynchoides TaxID=125765 RepID=UPI003A997256